MFQAGWHKTPIAVSPDGFAMHGFGQPRHRATAPSLMPLYARALAIRDADGQTLSFCCLDTGYVTWSMRQGIVARLQAQLGKAFDEALLVLTCTHTHSGPGGCAHEAMYNLVTPGFVPAHLEAVTEAAVAAIGSAWTALAPSELALGQDCFQPAVPVAWNRSLAAWNRNPDVTRFTPGDNHLALDRGMQVLAVRQHGQLQALLSLFGVHATCLSSNLNRYDGDNKGRAAAQAEQTLSTQGATAPVAIFAQATAGDVSPHYHGPGAARRRQKIKGEAEYAHASENGRFQSDLALQIADGSACLALSGALDGVLTYVDFSDQHADPRHANGEKAAYTSPPAHGVAFFAGTPVDGPGVNKGLAAAMSALAWAVKRYRHDRMASFPHEEQAYLQRLYAAQGPKPILMESGRKRVLGMDINDLRVPAALDPTVAEIRRQAAAGALRESPLVPTVLPLQIVRLGQLAIVCCPGEFTTTAGRRVRETVASVLSGQGITRVLICTYCNDYMGYVTTYEEYQEQSYEGGHTIFGQWTLAAFQTGFEQLAGQLLRPPAERNHDTRTRPADVPRDELARRTAGTHP